jgi:uncharacterized protein (TIGR00297 family)
MLAFASAAAVSILAYFARQLSASGAAAATIVGAAAFSAGASWVVLLLLFFTTSSALSLWRARERDALTASLVEKGGRRDAAQVLANGGVFAVAAALSALGTGSIWPAIGAGAIATAMADTWSTEVGTLYGGVPRLILGGRPVPPGTSGGITLAGTSAGVVGAFLAAVTAVMMDWGTSLPIIVSAGVVGFLVDSLLGATVQERRWCGLCGRRTERRIHTCGTPTTHRGGIRGWNNDLVNFTGTLAGAAVSWVFTSFLSFV